MTLLVDNLRVMVYPNDHRPAHDHVIGAGKEAVFRLNCPSGPLESRENHGFSSRQLERVADELLVNLDALREAWRRIHGNT